MTHEETCAMIDGLWRSLLRNVPPRRRDEACALATAIALIMAEHHQLRGRDDERREHAAREDALKARREQVQLEQMPVATDAPRTWKDEAFAIRIFEKTETPH